MQGDGPLGGAHADSTGCGHRAAQHQPGGQLQGSLDGGVLQQGEAAGAVRMAGLLVFLVLLSVGPGPWAGP